MPGLFSKAAAGGMSEDEPIDDDAFDDLGGDLGGEPSPMGGPSEHIKMLARDVVGDDEGKIAALYELVKAVIEEGPMGEAPPLPGDEEGLPPL
jgi:hypothetical protein